MVEWKEYKVQDVCDKVVSGGTPLTSNKDYYYPATVPWLKTGEVNYSYIYKTENFISEKGLEKSSAKLIPVNSVIVAMYGQGDTAGRVAVNKIPLSTNQACCNLQINEKIAHYAFVYYYLWTQYQQLVLYKTGGAQPNLNVDKIKKLKILLPPLPTQQKIASILSAYDNLIQNYKKQIDALQTAASELYKEWFVRFRFPGYQSTKFENGIPERWKVVLASELGEFVRGKNITAEEMQEGMIPVVSAGIEPSGFHNQSNVKGVSLTISNSGANAGYLQINYSDIWAADCSYCNSAKHIYFYYELLNNMRIVLFNLQKGAAQPHVYAKDINKMKILLPPSELIKTANKKIKLMHEKIYSLQQQITNLTQQRDLLLPRLMSGKLEVKNDQFLV